MSVRASVPSGITKRVYRQTSQSVCPWNVRFAQELTEPAFAPRAAIADKHARTFARDVLAMTPAEFSAAFRARR